MCNVHVAYHLLGYSVNVQELIPAYFGVRSGTALFEAKPHSEKKAKFTLQNVKFNQKSDEFSQKGDKFNQKSDKIHSERAKSP